MKTRNQIMTWAASSLIVAISLTAAPAAEEIASEAQQSIANFKKADSTLNTFFDKSAGYAVFPNVSKGGLVVGGAHGKGLVYEKGTAIGQASMSQASIGAQAGGQTFAEVIFFETPQALENFKTGKFEMSAEVSAVAAAEGASRAAKYREGVAVFTLPKKGLMVQASVGGQRFKYEPMAVGKPGTSQGTEKGKQ